MTADFVENSEPAADNADQASANSGHNYLQTDVERLDATPAEAVPVDLSVLGDIAALPVSQHASVYEQVHASLRAALADVER